MREESDITFIGRCNFRGDHRGFGIKRADRRFHHLLLGKTGTGKSTALGNLILQDLARGEGVALVDPHGDLADTVLEYVPPARTNDVVYFDPFDLDFPIGFNVLETVPPEHPRFAAEKTLVASGLIAVFKKLWSDSWGPRLEHILRNTILALLDSPGNTLLGVLRMLGEEAFRDQVVRRVRDPLVRAFWTDEFAGWSDHFRSEAVSPIQNKVGQFLSTSLIRNIVAQPRSTIDLREVMDTGKILILNLAKGKIGEDNSALLGAMMITRIQLAAMDRARIPEHERRDFYLYVDEFQNFATEAFAAILSEARKYRLSVTLAHQFTAQVPPALRDAVFGNVGTIVCFRVGGADAELLRTELGSDLRQDDLVNLQNYNAYIKLTVDGTPTSPFSMETTPLSSRFASAGDRERILRVSRERYGRPRSRVEERIARWTAGSSPLHQPNPRPGLAFPQPQNTGEPARSFDP
jgi:type IV secretory pathway TraG/TraD family ATPase VirD4